VLSLTVFASSLLGKVRDSVLSHCLCYAHVRGFVVEVDVVAKVILLLHRYLVSFEALL
jgi:hypothetical protein